MVMDEEAVKQVVGEWAIARVPGGWSEGAALSGRGDELGVELEAA